jgi:hypothetical protein
MRPRDHAFFWYPGASVWCTPLVGGRHAFIQNNVRLLDARTCFFYLATGITSAVPVKIVGGAALVIIVVTYLAG